jgi:hypothetical protein
VRETKSLLDKNDPKQVELWGVLDNFEPYLFGLSETGANG